LEHPIFFTPLEEFAKENIRYQNRPQGTPEMPFLECNQFALSQAQKENQPHRSVPQG